MTTLKTDCRKFAPNIFNKTKCQNCFRTKDAHSAEALESNRATRKVAKCGYLFVAPDWDFSVSINRTKRWQRRWFVLYDDGELTYSVDEHPDTVPQAVIDMNRVLEVSDAEDLTGNQFSLAITAPEKIHFIKGTSREESKWWFDILSRFPRTMVRGKHKRNATFPGGKATTVPCTSEKRMEVDGQSENIMNHTQKNRPRFLSCSGDNTGKGRSDAWQGNTNEDAYPTKDNEIILSRDNKEKCRTSTPTENNKNVTVILSNNISMSKKMVDLKNLNNTISSGVTLTSNTSSSSSDKENIIVSTPSKQESAKNGIEGTQEVPSRDRPKADDADVIKGRSRRYLKRESRGLKSQRSRSDGVAKMIPSLVGRDVDGLNEWTNLNNDSPASRHKNYHHNPVYLLLSDVPKIKRFESLESLHTDTCSPLLSRRRHASEKNGSMARQLSFDNDPQEVPQRDNGLHRSGSLVSVPTNSVEWQNRTNALHSGFGHRAGRDSRTSSDSKCSSVSSSMRPVRDTDTETQVRGDPDGCGLDSVLSYSSLNSEIRVEPTSEGLFVKKGWLMRLGVNREWFKHWFVLRNSSLTYFRDPTAEDSGIMDGVLDLALVKSVEERDLGRNFAFCVTTWDDKKHVLSAPTAGICSNWIQAICQAADSWDAAPHREFAYGDRLEKDIRIHEHSSQKEGKVIAGLHHPAPQNEEPERLTDVSSSDDHSEYFSIVDDDDNGEQSPSSRTLPPSPPLNRTAISRVKERARSRSSSRSRVSRQLKTSVTAESDQKPAIADNDQISDGGGSDRSSSSFQGLSSPLWMRHACTQDGMAEKHRVWEKPVPLLDGTQELVPKAEPDRRENPSGGCEQQIRCLEARCKEMEEQLQLKVKEVGEKTAKLDNLKNLRGSYRDLLEKYYNLKKRADDHPKRSGEPGEALGLRLRRGDSLRTRHRRERGEEKLSKEKSLSLGNLSDTKKEISLGDLQFALMKSKEQLGEVKTRLQRSPEKKDSSLATWKDISKLYEDIEKILIDSERLSKKDTEILKLKNCVSELQAQCTGQKEELARQKDHLASLRSSLSRREEEIHSMQQEFARAKEEKFHLLQKLQQLEAIIRKYECLSEGTEAAGTKNLELGEAALTTEYSLLKNKFNRALEEIRNLKKELRDADSNYSDMELMLIKLKQDMKGAEEVHLAQTALMTARVDDLTSKLTASERNLRQLKQKLSKAEAKQERRRSSLKGKEVLNLSREFEAKLTELEQKISAIECGNHISPLQKSSGDGDNADVSQGPKQSERKGSQDGSGEGQSLLLRLCALDNRTKNLSSPPEKPPPVTEKPKICLQVKSEEESNAPEEEVEDWSTLSITTSMTDLQALDDADQDFPSSIIDCLDTLGKKVDNMLSWLTMVLQALHRQEQSSATDSEDCKCSDGRPNTEELSRLVDVLDYLTSSGEETFMMTTTSEGSHKSFMRMVYNMLVIQEISAVLYQLCNFGKLSREVLLQSLQGIDQALTSFQTYIQQCLEGSKSIGGTLQLLTRHIFTSVDPLHLSSTGNTGWSQTAVEQSPDSTLHLNEQLLERVATVESKLYSSRCLVNKLKEMLYGHPECNSTDFSDRRFARSPECPESSVLTKQELALAEVMQVVSSMAQTVEKQLLRMDVTELNLLSQEQEAIQLYQSYIGKSLRDGMDALATELKSRLLASDSTASQQFSDSLLATGSLQAELFLGQPQFLQTVAELAQVVAIVSVLTGWVDFVKAKVQDLVDGGANMLQQETRTYQELKLNTIHSHLKQQAKLIGCRVLQSLASGNGEKVRLERDWQLHDTVSENVTGATSLWSRYRREIEQERASFQDELQKLQSELDSVVRERDLYLTQGCATCKELQEKVSNLHLELVACQESSQAMCQQCITLQNQLQNMLEQHQKELSATCTKYERDQEDMYRDWKNAMEQKNKVHAMEIDRLHLELKLSQRHAKHLEVEFEEQIRSLQELYEQKLSHRHEVINEEAIRRRYGAEIEQLKCLCEKGLVAMENSHRRIISELEKKHKHELAQLEVEKEKALAEETQATLAALDAMRKAHEEEVQREVAKFKNEFLRKMQVEQETEVLHKEHENELEEIKKEILSLSEKYSIKCLENASLEERVEIIGRQLQEANFQVFDLLARNKQLRAHLSSDIAQKKDILPSHEGPADVEDLKHLLRLRDGELAEQKEENAHLRQELHVVQTQQMKSAGVEKLHRPEEATPRSPEGCPNVMPGEPTALPIAKQES